MYIFSHANIVNFVEPKNHLSVLSTARIRLHGQCWVGQSRSHVIRIDQGREIHTGDVSSVYFSFIQCHAC